MAREQVLRFRCEPKLKKRLMAAAKADGRTMSNLMEHIVSNYLKAWKEGDEGSIGDEPKGRRPK